MSRWREFLEGEDKRFSMMRLTVFGSFVVSSVIMLWLMKAGEMAQGYMVTYVSTFALGYLGGKGIEKWGNKPSAKK
jgi:hypothetical protein